MYCILIVSEDFVLRKAVAFSLNDLDACVECADTVVRRPFGSGNGGVPEISINHNNRT